MREWFPCAPASFVYLGSFSPKNGELAITTFVFITGNPQRIRLPLLRSSRKPTPRRIPSPPHHPPLPPVRPPPRPNINHTPFLLSNGRRRSRNRPLSTFRPPTTTTIKIHTRRKISSRETKRHSKNVHLQPPPPSFQSKT